MHPPCRHLKHANALHQFERSRLALYIGKDDLVNPKISQNEKTTAGLDVSRFGME